MGFLPHASASTPAQNSEYRTDIFLLNPGAHSKFYQGTTKRIGSSVVMVIVAAVCLLGAAILGFTLFRANQNTQSVLNNGELITGQVVDLSSRSSGRNSTGYYVTYRWRVADSTYTREQLISREHYQRLREGAPIEVLYDRSDPSNSMLGGKDRDDSSNTSMSTIIHGAVFVLCFVAWFALWKDNRNRQLSAKGKILHGQIISTKGQRNSKGAFSAFIEYAFDTPDGRQLTRKALTSRRDLEKSMPPPGTSVAVLYLDDQSMMLL
jgi:hypothetical protein